MKNKKWILPLCIVAGVIIFLVLCFFVFMVFMNAKGYGMSVGRVLFAKDGSCILVVDEKSPIRMSDRTKKGDLFDKLSTGDKILVIHSGVEASYPAHTGANWLVKLSDGSRDDLPQRLIDELTAMGWLSHIYSDNYSFSLQFGTYGESFYDSESGRLVKTTNATNPSKYVGELLLSDADLETIFDMIWAMDISAYPDEYDPINPPDAEMKLASNPYETIVLTYRAGDYEKVITCNEVALGGGGYDARAEAFLSLCNYIERIVRNSDEWQALPEYEIFYE